METEQNCNILTPTLLAITAFLFRSPGCSTGGLGAKPLWDMFSFQHFPPTGLFSNSSDPQLQLFNRGPEGPLCWVLAFSTASYHQLIWSPKLTDFLSSLSYIIVPLTPSSCGRQKLHSFNPSTVKVIIS